MLSAPVLADTPTMSSVPGNSMTVAKTGTKQNIYDPGGNKRCQGCAGSQYGEVTALIISVGSFLGNGEMDVAAPISR
jgi:hypothetical protein